MHGPGTATRLVAPRRAQSRKPPSDPAPSRVRAPRTVRSLGAVAAVAVLSAGACDNRPLALGDVNAIAMTAAPELWAHVGEQVMEDVEGQVFTVRDDWAFRVSYQEPGGEGWLAVRILKQQLVIGAPSDPWMAPVLGELGEYEEPVDAAVMVQVNDVWSRGQLVTALVLPDGSEAAAAAEMVRQSLPALRETFESQYRDWVVAKMFVSGRDTELEQTLIDEHGFSLLLPEVYEYEVQDSVHIFLNDNPNPSELIRQFAITWRSPAPAEVDGEALLEWRAHLVEHHYDFPQVVNTERWISGPERFAGMEAYRYQAVWENPPDEYPAAGPFITWAVQCPAQERMYVIDAWLYAPGKDKYEYMIQLDEILGSFRCVDDQPG